MKLRAILFDHDGTLVNLMALERLGITADECLAIEDTQHGLEAAYSAGIKCLALPTEMSKHHDFELATAVLGGMSEAVEYVRQIIRPL